MTEPTAAGIEEAAADREDECFLEGIRVLDLSRVLAGPLATQILGDLGAEVLKVEPPWGDETRGWGPPFVDDTATYYLSCNRDRASLVIDANDLEQRARLQRIAGVADVVIDNFPPARRRRLGLDRASLAAGRPDLITVSIVGYPGAGSERPGYDLVLQAESGLMGITGPVDGEPSKVGVALVDVLTGTMAANAVLAALVRRLRRGIGAELTVSLLRTAIFSLVNVASAALATGAASRRWGNAHPSLAPYEAFATADRPIVVAVGSDRQWRSLCEVLPIEDGSLAALDNAGRVERRAEVVAAITAASCRVASEELLERLRRAGIPCGPILRPDQALQSAIRLDPGTVLAVEHPRRGAETLVATPFEGRGLRRGHRAAPDLGEGGVELAERWLAESRPGRAGAYGRLEPPTARS